MGNSKATENKDSENVIKDYTYDPNDGGTVGQAVFTNEKVITDWDIVKVSASSDTLKLEGAQFTLKDSNGNVRYTGNSNANGKIEWKENGVAVSNLTQGTYEFQETKAPAGYSVSAEKWTILIASNGYLKSIKKAVHPQNILKCISFFINVNYVSLIIKHFSLFHQKHQL